MDVSNQHLFVNNFIQHFFYYSISYNKCANTACNIYRASRHNCYEYGPQYTWHIIKQEYLQYNMLERVDILIVIIISRMLKEYQLLLCVKLVKQFLIQKSCIIPLRYNTYTLMSQLSVERQGSIDIKWSNITLHSKQWLRYNIAQNFKVTRYR